MQQSNDGSQILCEWEPTTSFGTNARVHWQDCTLNSRIL